MTVSQILDDLCGPRFVHGPKGSFGRVGGWLHHIVHDGGGVSINTFVAEVVPDVLPMLEHQAPVTFGMQPFSWITIDHMEQPSKIVASIVHAHVTTNGPISPMHVAILLSESCAAAQRSALFFRLIGSTLLCDFDEAPLELAERIASMRIGSSEPALAPPILTTRKTLDLVRHPPLHECPGWRCVPAEGSIDTTVWFGPYDLPGGSGGSAIGLHALACREVPESPELWSLLREHNEEERVSRAGVFVEPGLKERLSVFSSLSLLTGGRWDMRSASGLTGIVERDAEELREKVLQRCGGDPGSVLEWVPPRSWSGAGGELRSEPLIRELEEMAPEEGYEQVHELLQQGKRTLSPETLAYALHLILDHAVRASQEPGGEQLWPTEPIAELLHRLIEDHPPEGRLSPGMVRRAQRLLGMELS